MEVFSCLADLTLVLTKVQLNDASRRPKEVSEMKISLNEVDTPFLFKISSEDTYIMTNIGLVLSTSTSCR